MTKGALAMAANDAFADIVDFVEEHGGSLSGEQRDYLFTLVGRVIFFTSREAALVEPGLRG